MVQQNSSFGLPGQGFVPTDVLAALYPYLTFGPNMAAQLAGLQFGAGLDVQNQNNALSMQLAQGAASNRLADNVASQLALQGLGPVPGFGSAFGQGNWGVNPVSAPNLLNLFGGFNQGLGNIFGSGFGMNGQGGTLPNQGGYPSLGGQFYGGGAFGVPPFLGPSGGVGGPMPPIPGGVQPNPTWAPPGGGTLPPMPGAPTQFRGGATPNAIDALLAKRAGNEALGDYYLRVSAGLEQYDPRKASALSMAAGGFPGGGLNPFLTALGATGGGGGGGSFPGGGTGGPLGPVQPQQPYQSPFAGVQQLAGFGSPAVRAGAGPSVFSDPALGISPFGAPRTTLGSYYGASPAQQEAQDYLYGTFGYSPETLARERATFTPGARQFYRPAFGGF